MVGAWRTRHGERLCRCLQFVVGRDSTLSVREIYSTSAAITMSTKMPSRAAGSLRQPCPWQPALVIAHRDSRSDSPMPTARCTAAMPVSEPAWGMPEPTIDQRVMGHTSNWAA